MTNSFFLLGLYANHPRAALRRAVDSRPIGFAFFIFVCSYLSHAVGTLIHSPAGSEQLLFRLVGLLPVQMAFGLIVLLLSACIIHFTAALSGENGNAISTIVFLAINSAPYLLMTPAALLFSTLGVSHLILLFGVGMGLWIFVFILNVICAQENYSMSFGKAFLVVAAPYLFLSGCLTVLGMSPFYLLVVFLLGSA